MGDSISDFITIIRNASRAKKASCEAKHSKLHWDLAKILHDEGFISAVREGKNKQGHKNIVVEIKYVDDTPSLSGIQRASKPGRRLYYSGKSIPRVLGGLRMGILTTSKGLMKDQEARRQNIGGELICTVW